MPELQCLQTLLDCEVVLAPYREGNLKEKITPDAQKCIARFHLDFRTSMADDLHTPVVLASLLEPLKTINTVLNSLKVLLFLFNSVLFQGRAITYVYVYIYISVCES